jgi:hypothetical protein
VADQRVEDLAATPAGGAHAGKAFGPVQLDRAVPADDGVVRSRDECRSCA